MVFTSRAQHVIHKKSKMMVKSSKQSVYCLQSLGMIPLHCDCCVVKSKMPISMGP